MSDDNMFPGAPVSLVSAGNHMPALADIVLLPGKVFPAAPIIILSPGNDFSAIAVPFVSKGNGAKLCPGIYVFKNIKMVLINKYIYFIFERQCKT